MNGGSPDELPPLGRKVEQPVPAPAEPTWKPLPGRPGYETNGGAVRRTMDSLLGDLNPWAEYMKALGRYERNI